MKKMSEFKINRLVLMGLAILISVFSIAGRPLVYGKAKSGSDSVTGYLPKIEEFKVDISKEKQNLINSFKMTKGLTLAYKESNQKLIEAAEAVSANPKDKEAVNNLDNVYAAVLGKLSQRMVLVLTEEPKITKSFKAINKEFTGAVKFLKSEQENIINDIKANEAKLEKSKKELGRKSRFYEGMPANSPDKEKLKEEIRELALELELTEYQLDLDNEDISRYTIATDRLDVYHNFYGKMEDQVGQLLKKIDAERRKYARIARRKDRFQNIRHVMWGVNDDEGGLADWIDNIEETFNILVDFSKVEKEVSDQIDRLTFTLPVRNGSSLADKIEEWDNSFSDKIKYFSNNYF